MLKHGIINPLNVFNLRQLKFCPPHFEKVYFDLQTRDKDIVNWIYENREGRFYLGTDYGSNKNYVGFELPFESSYFLLMLDSINRIN